MTKKYIISGTDDSKNWTFGGEQKKKEEHPYLFTKDEFTMNELCRYMSFGQGRDNPSGPMQLQAFMDSIGIIYRHKYW